MMNLLKTAVATALVAFSAGSFAAKPTSIVFVATGETAEGNAYATYNVKCSDGHKVELTAWDNRRRWCVGDTSSDICEKKQIQSAKAACKGS